MTRLLVVSDTHLSLGARLPDPVLELADRADHVIHAGDFTGSDVLDTLEALAPVTAACGNCDGLEIAARVPERAMVELAGVSVAVVHDAGAQSGRHERLQEWFPGARVVVYGHSHMPELVESATGQLVLNPGSPVQRRRAPDHTVAWLELRDGEVVDAHLVHLD
ncbi:MAG: metallophosphoesterase family protein [Thermoleophilia bacterium]|nr:metallophosphoesterase family protein [Thermoleophilia bacterium]